MNFASLFYSDCWSVEVPREMCSGCSQSCGKYYWNFVLKISLHLKKVRMTLVCLLKLKLCFGKHVLLDFQAEFF